MHSHQPVRALTAPLRSLLFIVLVVAMTPGATFADSVDELHALVDANDVAAWGMAQRMEPDNAGDPEFDFWYGLAAKAAGKKHEAVFAFERVVLNQPENSRAKLELADAYFQFGNTGEARRLFEDVLATTPPDPVQQRIRTYLGAIDAADSSRKTHVSGFVTLAGGYDSNVNSATSVVMHDIPGFAYPVALPASAVESEAGFLDLRAGVDVVQPVNNRKVRFLSLAVQDRDNADIFSGGNFDNVQLNVTGGWLLQRGVASWRIPVNLQALSVENDESRYVGTIGAEYNRPLKANTAISWFGQAGEMHFPSQVARNAWLALAGGAWTWNGTSTPLRLTTSLHVGTEPAKDSQYDFNGRDYVAIRANLRYGLTARQAVYGAIGAQSSHYRDKQPILGYEREEILADAAIGWQVQFDRRWSMNADVSYANNASARNDIYDFQRTVVMLGSTWRF